MLTLLIETSTERGAVFFFKAQNLAYECYLPPGLHNSTDLMPAIMDGLSKLGVHATDLGLIGVGVGPGSYTGLRVGAMAAKTLSYACRVPLVGLCTLSCFSKSAEHPHAVIIDAKIGGAYLLPWKGAPLVCPLEAVSSHVKPGFLLVTPSCRVLSEKLALVYPRHEWQWEESPPSPKSMLDLALQKYHAGECSLDGSLELLYMRKTQAEIERGK